MSEIKNPKAYFGTLVRNSQKDEYRANDNFFKHISSVGDEADIQREALTVHKHDSDSIEQQLCEADVESWLLFMESERLHSALTRLLPAQVVFLYELAAFDFDQTKYAAAKGIRKQSVSDRFRRICKKIKKSF